jgi:hypothetical protein
VRQVNLNGIEVVGQERTALAAFFPICSQHEMVDDQLVPAREQIRERLRTVRACKNIIFLHAFPRKFAPPPAKFVTFPRKFLFSRQMRHTRL